MTIRKSGFAERLLEDSAGRAEFKSPFTKPLHARRHDSTAQDQPQRPGGTTQMNPTALHFPRRAAKPRDNGITMVIDGGIPLHQFADTVESAAEYIDFVKF